MFHDILFLILGLVLIIAGGNYLTDGAVSVAKRFGISSLVIGLTIVAFGSSTPDFVVCFISTLSGKSELALGDVLGANIFDITLIIGIIAMIAPVRISSEMAFKDLPMLALSSIALFICGDDRIVDGTNVNIVNRTDGLMLLSLFVIFMCYTMEMARSHSTKPISTRPKTAAAIPHHSVEKAEATEADNTRRMKPWVAAVCILGGLAALVFGGQWLVDGASGLARRLGMSEALIGLTIVGIGSSIPDLSTSVIAAIKKQPQIAIGNVVGACIFNVFFIIGLCSTVKPLNAGSLTFVDFGTLVLGSLLVLLFGDVIVKRTITRLQGAILAGVYIAYMVYLVVNAAC
ncbi:calcium/sodium antiporter [Muribaculum intestinale]|uniref:Calcium/sodium antiporter n=1 Tax=Muribaculum intestinale TaxID=1796646 RepID=A0A4S2G135_9BACT|nr:calcium/sodium antiporter [Muribaculum intestinale]MYM12055.1 calcium/sodium antiporter [Muribaculum intestinale]TGY75382.1 calcium/sodium antiporter [Muribaculum intestinale]